MGLVYSLTGCVSFPTDYRKEGFKIVQKGFVSIEESPEELSNLHEVIELKNVRIHIVGQRKFMKWGRALKQGSRVLGYATSRNEIYLFGKIVDGKIIVNQAVLGHELNHLLNFKNPKIADPDKLDDLGV